jgi:pseudouridine kinase
MMQSMESLSRTGPVLVIGASGLDVIAHLSGSFQAGSSNPAKVRTSYGGVARNVAENLARLGQDVILITAMGEDQNGTQVLAHTEDSGVDISQVIRTDVYPTGFYMGVVNKKGQVELAVDDMRVMSILTPDELKARTDLFKSASLVFLDANLPEDTLKKAVSLAHKYKVPLCADPASPSLALRLMPHLPALSLITPNSTEAGILSGKEFNSSDRKSAMQVARHLVNLGVDIALITLAEFGVCYATSETSGQVPALKTKIVDPTGAGDALTAAVIFALLNEMDIDEAIKLGVSAASLTLRHPGTVVPDLSLEKLYDQLLV